MQPKKGIQTPIINELLGFTLATTEIWENLANGTAVMATSLALQLGTYTESAEAFWKPWKSINVFYRCCIKGCPPKFLSKVQTGFLFSYLDPLVLGSYVSNTLSCAPSTSITYTSI